MKHVGTWLIAALAALLATGSLPARADQVGVGVEASFTGPFSIWGKEYKEAIDLFLAQIHDHVGSHQIKMYYGDDGGMNPARAKQLAQEMVVRDHVAVLGGGELTPNTNAIASFLNQAKVPFVIFNSGEVKTTDRSRYFVRVAETIWADYYPLGVWAAKFGHYQRCVGIAGDYSPGVEAMEAAKRGFESHGGKIIDTIMVPLSTEDFSSYIERIRNDRPQCTIGFIPLGPQSAAFVKAYTGAGLMKAGVPFLGQSETWEPDLPALGDAALGIITAFPYSPNLDNPTNRAFVAAFEKRYGTEPTDIAVLAYNGMTVIARMIKATDGKRDAVKAIAAAEGFAWMSPQGPVSIDPKTREITQNIYIRKVENVNGKLVNQVIYTFKNEKEPWHQLNH
jgi:branched-chain amino acid transport system substrate-binding protein